MKKIGEKLGGKQWLAAYISENKHGVISGGGIGGVARLHRINISVIWRLALSQ